MSRLVRRLLTALLLLTATGLLRARTAHAESAQVTAERPEVIDRVVAVVQLRQGVAERRAGTPRAPPDVISLSGLEFEARVALVQRGARRAATEDLDESTLRAALEHAINERLLAGEAEMLQSFGVEPSEVDAALKAFRDRFITERELRGFLARHEADVPALARVLERSLRAAKVLDGKVRLRAQVSEAEVRAFYEKQRTRLEGDYETLRPLLRERLMRDRYAELVKGELESLRRTHEVRKVAPFARAGTAPEERG